MLERLIDGGWMMLPLGACSVIMIAVLIERTRAFYRTSKIDNRSLRAQITGLLAKAASMKRSRSAAARPGRCPQSCWSACKPTNAPRPDHFLPRPSG